MKITDLKCALIGRHPIVRITTDAGIDGFGQIELYKPFLKPHVLMYRDALIGEDPTLVERVMLKIRQRQVSCFPLASASAVAPSDATGAIGNGSRS